MMKTMFGRAGCASVRRAVPPASANVPAAPAIKARRDKDRETGSGVVSSKCRLEPGGWAGSFLGDWQRRKGRRRGSRQKATPGPGGGEAGWRVLGRHSSGGLASWHPAAGGGRGAFLAKGAVS